MLQHAPTPSKLRFDGLSKTFAHRAGQAQARPVLDSIDLDIDAGEFLIVVGPSGCGKSTLLDLAAGLSTPSEGRVMLDGQEVTEPGSRRAVVFQNYALLPWKTALGNIVFALAAAGVPRAERARKARRVLDIVGLADIAHSYPHQLSGGMKQRIAIARSLAVEPEILLMDEPFAALDAQSREALQAELRNLWRRTGTTILFITHDIDEALILGQRIVVLSRGPGRVAETIDLPFERDADIDDIRASAEYAPLRQHVRDAIGRNARRPS